MQNWIFKPLQAMCVYNHALPYLTVLLWCGHTIYDSWAECLPVGAATCRQQTHDHPTPWRPTANHDVHNAAEIVGRYHSYIGLIDGCLRCILLCGMHCGWKVAKKGHQSVRRERVHCSMHVVDHGAFSKPCAVGHLISYWEKATVYWVLHHAMQQKAANSRALI